MITSNYNILSGFNKETINYKKNKFKIKFDFLWGIDGWMEVGQWWWRMDDFRNRIRWFLTLLKRLTRQSPFGNDLNVQPSADNR